MCIRQALKNFELHLNYVCATLHSIVRRRGGTIRLQERNSRKSALFQQVRKDYCGNAPACQRACIHNANGANRVRRRCSYEAAGHVSRLHGIVQRSALCTVAKIWIQRFDFFSQGLSFSAPGCGASNADHRTRRGNPSVLTVIVAWQTAGAGADLVRPDYAQPLRLSPLPKFGVLPSSTHSTSSLPACSGRYGCRMFFTVTASPSGGSKSLLDLPSQRP